MARGPAPAGRAIRWTRRAPPVTAPEGPLDGLSAVPRPLGGEARRLTLTPCLHPPRIAARAPAPVAARRPSRPVSPPERADGEEAATRRRGKRTGVQRRGWCPRVEPTPVEAGAVALPRAVGPPSRTAPTMGEPVAGGGQVIGATAGLVAGAATGAPARAVGAARRTHAATDTPRRSTTAAPSLMHLSRTVLRIAIIEKPCTRQLPTLRFTQVPWNSREPLRRKIPSSFPYKMDHHNRRIYQAKQQQPSTRDPSMRGRTSNVRYIAHILARPNGGISPLHKSKCVLICCRAFVINLTSSSEVQTHLARLRTLQIGQNAPSSKSAPETGCATPS